MQHPVQPITPGLVSADTELVGVVATVGEHDLVLVLRFRAPHDDVPAGIAVESLEIVPKGEGKVPEIAPPPPEAPPAEPTASAGVDKEPSSPEPPQDAVPPAPEATVPPAPAGDSSLPADGTPPASDAPSSPEGSGGDAPPTT